MVKKFKSSLERANIYANIFRVILWAIVVAIPSIGGWGLLDAHKDNATKIATLDREVLALRSQSMAQIYVINELLDRIKRHENYRNR